MCLGELGQVTSTSESTAVVRAGSRLLTAALLTAGEPIDVGDWVLVHSGLVLTRLTADEAADALRLRTHGDGVTP